mgnify:CR=1 FL=1
MREALATGTEAQAVNDRAPLSSVRSHSSQTSELDAALRLLGRENVAASYKVHHMMMHAQAHRAHNLQWVSVIPRDRYAMRYPARRFASLSALPMPYAEMVSCPPPCAAGG